MAELKITTIQKAEKTTKAKTWKKAVKKIKTMGKKRCNFAVQQKKVMPVHQKRHLFNS